MKKEFLYFGIGIVLGVLIMAALLGSPVDAGRADKTLPVVTLQVEGMTCVWIYPDSSSPYLLGRSGISCDWEDYRPTVE